MMGDCLRACVWTAELCGLVPTWTARATTQARRRSLPPCNAAASFKALHKHGLSSCSTPGPTLVLGRQQGTREGLPAGAAPAGLGKPQDTRSAEAGERWEPEERNGGRQETRSRQKAALQGLWVVTRR